MIRRRLHPDHRNDGKFQFTTGYTGGGAEMTVHLTRDEIIDRMTEKHGPGTLTDDGIDLWWEQQDKNKFLNFRDEVETEVKKKIEVGEAKWSISLSCDGVTIPYTLRLTYSFDYEEKEGEVSQFGMRLKTDRLNRGERTCEALGEYISEDVAAVLREDFTLASAEQINDMVEEVLGNIETVTERNNWRMFDTSHDRHVFHEE